MLRIVLLAVVLSLGATQVADAAKFLSKSDARYWVRKREREIQNSNPAVLGFEIYGCIRQSRTRFNCGADRYWADGDTCTTRWSVWTTNGNWVNTRGSFISCE